MQFQNPQNGYVEEVGGLAWLWVLLFGPIYFATKGVWSHAVAGALLALLTAGLSWLLYPFFARTIMRTHYQRRGWLQIDPEPKTATDSRQTWRIAHDQLSQQRGTKTALKYAASIGAALRAVCSRVQPTKRFLKYTAVGVVLLLALVMSAAISDKMAVDAETQRVGIAAAQQCAFKGTQTAIRIRVALRNCEVVTVHEDSGKLVKFTDGNKHAAVVKATEPDPEPAPSAPKTPSSLEGKCSADLRETAQRIVLLHGYRCDVVNFCMPFLWSRGTKIVCNGYNYTYNVYDRGGRPVVEVQ